MCCWRLTLTVLKGYVSNMFQIPGGKKNLFRRESLEREELSKQVCPGIAIQLQKIIQIVTEPEFSVSVFLNADTK